MDLTHETFVHGSSSAIARSRNRRSTSPMADRFVTVTRWMRDIIPPPHWAIQYEYRFGKLDRVDRWQIIRFEAPSTVVIDVGVCQGSRAARRRAIARWVIMAMC